MNSSKRSQCLLLLFVFGAAACPGLGLEPVAKDGEQGGVSGAGASAGAHPGGEGRGEDDPNGWSDDVDGGAGRYDGAAGRGGRGSGAGGAGAPSGSAGGNGSSGPGSAGPGGTGPNGPGAGAAGAGGPSGDGTGTAGAGGQAGDQGPGGDGGAGGASGGAGGDEDPWGGSGSESGGAGGSPSGGAGNGAGTDGPAQPSAEALQWLGRWSGALDYPVPDGVNFWTGEPEFKNKQTPIEMRVLTFESVAERPGWGTIGGRISAGNCVLSTEFQGEVFVGDELSPVRMPVVSIGVLGRSDGAVPVHMTISGKRNEGKTPTITGTISFAAMDAPVPCVMKGLSFKLEPLDLTTNVSH
jgi:hypothetical protein